MNTEAMGGLIVLLEKDGIVSTDPVIKTTIGWCEGWLNQLNLFEVVMKEYEIGIRYVWAGKRWFPFYYRRTFNVIIVMQQNEFWCQEYLITEYFRSCWSYWSTIRTLLTKHSNQIRLCLRLDRLYGSNTIILQHNRLM